MGRAGLLAASLALAASSEKWERANHKRHSVVGVDPSCEWAFRFYRRLRPQRLYQRRLNHHRMTNRRNKKRRERRQKGKRNAR